MSAVRNATTATGRFTTCSPSILLAATQTGPARAVEVRGAVQVPLPNCIACFQRVVVQALQQTHLNRVLASPSTTPPPTTNKTSWWLRPCAPNMLDVESVQELVDVLHEHRDRLVVVDYWARWCGACKALYPRLIKLAEANPDVLFVKINWDDNKDLAKRLGIKVLPFFQLYRGREGRVAQFSANLGKFQLLHDALAQYGAARCSLGMPDAPLDAFPDVKPGAAHGNNVVPAPAGILEGVADPA